MFCKLKFFFLRKKIIMLFIFEEMGFYTLQLFNIQPYLWLVQNDCWLTNISKKCFIMENLNISLFREIGISTIFHKTRMTTSIISEAFEKNLESQRMKDNTKKQKNGQSELLSKCLLIINSKEMRKNILNITKPYIL